MDVRVIVQKEATTPYGPYRPVIVMDSAFFNSLTSEQLEIMLDAETAKWVNTMRNAIPPMAPPKPRVYTKFGFLSLFTAGESAAMEALKQGYAITGFDQAGLPLLSTTPNVQTLMLAQAFATKINIADEINLDEDVTKAGLEFLVSQGVITADRKAEILSV